MSSTFLAEMSRIKGITSLRKYNAGLFPKVRLLCFPWAGAGASVYRKLARSCPDWMEVWAVQLPGREERYAEPRLLDMSACAEHVVQDLKSLSDLPLVLFGHSMGARLAFEVAHHLSGKMGFQPAGLVVSGSAAPQLKKNSWWHLATDQELLAHLSWLGGTPETILKDSRAMKVLLPILRADYEALETCTLQHQERLTCPLLICTGLQDHSLSLADVKGWTACTTGPSVLHPFKGGHFYLTDAEQAVTQVITDWTTVSLNLQEEKAP